MMRVDNDGQMILRDHGGLKLPDICLTGGEKHRKNLTQEICPDRGSNQGPPRNRRICYHLVHSGGLRTLPKFTTEVKYQFLRVFDQIKDQEIPITLRPVYWRGYLKEEDAGGGLQFHGVKTFMM